MWSIARLRQHPHFAPLFGHVHPLCWLILWWELNRLIRWYETWRPENVLYAVNGWGRVSVHCIVPRTDPHLYRPIPRTFRELSHPSWETGLPDTLEPVPSIWHALVFRSRRGLSGIRSRTAIVPERNQTALFADSS